MVPNARGQRGFSLTELLLTVAMGATLTAMAVPLTADITASIKVGEAARLIERELQDARLRAVSTNQRLRVRVNCPSTGFLRTVEVLGTTADTAADRCLPTTYPFPPDDNLITRPNYDGPVRTIPHETTATTTTLEFQPDGTVQLIVAGVAQRITADQTITITRRSLSRVVRVNGAGRVKLD